MESFASSAQIVAVDTDSSIIEHLEWKMQCGLTGGPTKSSLFVQEALEFGDVGFRYTQV